MSHDHYKKDVSHLKFIDPYRIADLYDMGGGPIEHAFKKVLCAGMRGHKSRERDVQDAIDSLLRWQEMQRENAGVGSFGQQNTVEWPADDTRIDAIGRNGNGGEHYAMQRCHECAAEHCNCVSR